MTKNIFSIGFVYLVAVAGWMLLGTTIDYRTGGQDGRLKESVGQLWGTPLEQRAPVAALEVSHKTSDPKPGADAKKKPVELPPAVDKLNAPLVQSDIKLGLQSEPRQKGLLWYSTFKADFLGNYVFENVEDKAGTLALAFTFPAADGIYDEFRFEVDGRQVPFNRQNQNLVVARVDCAPRSRHQLTVGYATHGLDRFMYRFGEGISEVRGFNLVATTDFRGYDLPEGTMSASSKQLIAQGWELHWNYADLISGNGIGIDMPKKINPGPMASRISFFAPVSLGFFFFLIFVIALLRGIDIHPMNYFFLAASFFAFHLLLAYLVDHISIHLAFLICSAVSIFLVVSYMRLVVGNRFAFMETALAQVIYLVGFSYAFFVEGFTGLAVTIGAIVTLFVVMQATARIDWTKKFESNGRKQGLAAALSQSSIATLSKSPQAVAPTPRAD
jgi:inner membrane protein CreD